MILTFLRTNATILCIAAALTALAFALGRCDGDRRATARHEAALAKANQRAVQTDSAAKEQAAVERANDTATIDAKQREQNDAVMGATGDADLRMRAACQRLRASGRSEASLARAMPIFALSPSPFRQ